jgi:anion-transporting  ArsA/GET3 family ATPase
MTTAQTKVRAADMTKALDEAIQHLERLSPDRLRVASDFLAYLEEREQSEATEELLEIPGFEEAFRRAAQQVEKGQIVRFTDIQRDV